MPAPKTPPKTYPKNPKPSLPDGLAPLRDLADTPTARDVLRLMGTGVLSDEQIRALCRANLPDAMITPYEPALVSEVLGERVVSFGPSSAGYDVRAADEWMLFDRDPSPLDPLAWDAASSRKVTASSITLDPGGFALARTVERFRVPRNVLVVCLGKSTYARCGLIVNVTPLEPGWEGYVTLELSNTGHRPVIVRANQGIAQMIFHHTAAPVRTSYADRKGKYQHQEGITPPR